MIRQLTDRWLKENFIENEKDERGLVLESRSIGLV